MNWLYYLAEANVYLGVFYLAYCLFLNRETYYQLNRAYLIISCIAAFILPVLQIGALKPVEPAAVVAYAAPVQTIYAVPAQTIPAADVQSTTTAAAATATPVIEHHFTLQQALWYGYIAGVVILLLVLLIKLYTLFRLMRNEQCIKKDKHKLIYLTGTDVAFSFLNYLFIGANAPGANTMIRHELVHIRQRHSADIIFIEVVKIISWFNPCIYLLQNSLKTVHEYIADEQTAAYETDALTYSSFLVNNAYGAGGSSITHSFFNYNLLKKRIIMLNQQRSGNLARLKYLVAVPICAGLLCVSTLAFSKTYGWVDLAPAKVSSSAADSADIVTPSGYKLGYEKLVWHFGLESSFFLNNYIQKDYILDHKNLTIKGGIVVVGFNVTDDHKLANLKVVSSTNDELNSVITNSLTSFNGTINDKPGAHTFLFHISTTGHTEEADEVICRKYGYDNHYTIAIASKITVNGDQNPPPMPPKPKVTQVKFPPPIVVPDAPDGYGELSNYLSKSGHAERITKNALSGSVIVNYIIKDDHKITDVKLVKSTKAFEEVALTILDALNAYTGTITDKPGEHILGINFYSYRTGLIVNKDKEFRNEHGYSGELYILIPPPKPRVTQAMFPPPVVKPIGNGYKKITYFIDPASYRGAAGLKKISSYLHDDGFQMDFKEIKTNGSNQLEISLETLPGHSWHRRGSATFDLDALKKLNYVIAVGGDNTKQMIYVHSVPNQVKFPPPIVKPDKIAPPPPSPQPVKVGTTTKGFKYEETAFLEWDTENNPDKDYQVVITEKKGMEKKYLRNASTGGEMKLLWDKYGYVFPVDEVQTMRFIGNINFDKRPEIDKRHLGTGKSASMMIRPQLVYIQVDSGGFDTEHKRINPSNGIPIGSNGLYIVNGKIYNHSDLERRSAAISTKTDIKTLFSAEYVIYHPQNSKEVIDKYGPMAQDGIYEFVNVRNSKL